MSIDATMHAWRAIRTFSGDADAKLVLLALADLAPVGDDDGVPTYRGLRPESLAEACGLSVERVRACLEFLAERGLVDLRPDRPPAREHTLMDCMRALHPEGQAVNVYGPTA